MSWRPGFDRAARPRESSRVLAVDEQRIALATPAGAAGEPLHVGWLDGEPLFAARAAGGLPADAPTLRALLAAGPEPLAQAATRAVHLLGFEETHRFCGSCGAESARSGEELARVCPHCGVAAYPRISPAVIMAVRRDDAVLLARRAGVSAFWSVLAGFVEPGETLEQAVAREVAEEVGLEVEEIRYAGSQPWPFPSQLMLGFSCRWAAGEIRLDETELAEAGWFRPDELPPIPPPFTIANRLIRGAT
ncbi:MAG TPA: NAD(+) diphosphatase [Gaiellaceae bacterium]|nr:NAD(+) diphosphatase [Gaiellaceae bacterium]